MPGKGYLPRDLSNQALLRLFLEIWALSSKSIGSFFTDFTKTHFGSFYSWFTSMKCFWNSKSLERDICREIERFRPMRPAELGAGAVWPVLERVWPAGLGLEATEACRPTNAEPWRHGAKRSAGMTERWWVDTPESLENPIRRATLSEGPARRRKHRVER